MVRLTIGTGDSTDALARDPDVSFLAQFETDENARFIRRTELIQNAIDLIAGSRFTALRAFFVADEPALTGTGFVARTADHTGVTGHAVSSLAVSARFTH